jgi:hypothetical protein
MNDIPIVIIIVALGCISYGLRAGGYLIGGAFANGGKFDQLFRVAPGNFFIAFMTAGCFDGGWTTMAGVAAAFGTMVATGKEWAGIGIGSFVLVILSALFKS